MHVQASEIAACQWMSFEAYEANMSKRMVPGSLYHELSMLAVDAFDGKADGFALRQMELGFRPGTNMLYSPPSDRVPSKL